MPEKTRELPSLEALRAETEGFIEELCQDLRKDFARATLTQSGSLNEIISYSISSGGKRVRPVLLALLANHFSLEASNYKGFSLALELVHAGSLIHDDLPCLDNDDLRRGIPSAHKQFGEAPALLAGDAINALANIQIVSKTKGLEGERGGSSIINSLVTLLSVAFFDVCKGQVLDISFSDDVKLKDRTTEEKISHILEIHKLKTASLFIAAFEAPGIMASLPEAKIKTLRELGEKFGLMFQLADDLADFREVKPSENPESLDLNVVAFTGEDKARGMLENESKDFLARVHDELGANSADSFALVLEIFNL